MQRYIKFLEETNYFINQFQIYFNCLISLWLVDVFFNRILSVYKVKNSWFKKNIGVSIINRVFVVKIIFFYCIN
jgi:hypothetical protein